MLPFIVHVIEMWSSMAFVFVLLSSQSHYPYSVSACICTVKELCSFILCSFLSTEHIKIHQFCPFVMYKQIFSKTD